VWLTIALAIVALGIILMVVTGFSVWRRWQRMRRAGGRFTRRVSSLSASAGMLADRLETNPRGVSSE
jgi:uncharacterized iron-regulated membrane protein